MALSAWFLIYRERARSSLRYMYHASVRPSSRAEGEAEDARSTRSVRPRRHSTADVERARQKTCQSVTRVSERQQCVTQWAHSAAKSGYQWQVCVSSHQGAIERQRGSSRCTTCLAARPAMCSHRPPGGRHLMPFAPGRPGCVVCVVQALNRFPHF
jgi:hypothetical protein